MKARRFHFDRTSSGHERLNCRCGRAVVRQPYMNLDQWLSAIDRFDRYHVVACHAPARAAGLTSILSKLELKPF